MDQMKSQPLHLLSEVNLVQGESSGSMNPGSWSADSPPVKHANMSIDLPEMQVDEANISFASESTVTLRQSNPGDSQHLTENHAGCSDGCKSSKLTFFLEGQKLNQKLTLYQAILLQQIKADNEIITGARVWSQVYSITYRRATESSFGLWRDDHSLCSTKESSQAENFDVVMSPFGLFPRPWSCAMNTSDGVKFSDIKNVCSFGSSCGKDSPRWKSLGSAFLESIL